MKRPHPKAYKVALSLTLLAPTAAVAQQPLRLSLPDRYLAADSPNSSQKTQNGKDDVQDKRTAPMPVWLAAGVASFASIALLSGTKGQKHKPGSGDHNPDPGAGQGGAAPSNGAGVIVGLADSGVQIEHPRLAGRVASTFNAFNGSNDASDHMGHGTSVAGIVSNIAAGSLIHIAKVFQNGASPSEVVSRGVGWLASTNAQILSLSLGSDAPVAERSLRAAVNNGKLVVAAMGNKSQSHAVWPAKFAGEGWAKGQIIAVGALDLAGNRANFSNWDPALAHFTVFAPGVNIQTAGLNGTTVSFSGTSAATPVVAAQAARIQGTWNFLKAREVAELTSSPS